MIISPAEFSPHLW